MNNSLQKLGGRPRRYGRIALDLALVVTLLAALLAWFFDPFLLRLGAAKLTVSWGFKPLLIPLALALLRRWVARGMTPPPPALFPRIALALAAVLLPLAAMESLLTRAGVQPGEGVFVVRGEEGGALRADGSMVKDATLLWRFQPGTVFNGRRINSLGFLGREVEARKPPGAQRVISLGDSCTAQGTPPYSGHLHELLARHPPDDRPWESFNTAVHGYSVLQGLALFQERVAALEPDLVTVFFGWNDHWLAEEQDADRLERAGSPFQTAWRNALARKRIFTLLASRARPAVTGPQIRVPPGEYQDGLEDLVAAIRSTGATPLLLTAPRARSLHGAIVHGGHARSIDEAHALHDQYAGITREVGRRKNARVLDLARLFAQDDHQHLFSRDGIHFTDDGLKRIAELIHAELLLLHHPSEHHATRR